MASLTHVHMWSGHGWVHVTAAEAARLHPGGTVSAKSGLFMCSLCGQYVILTDGRERDRYFKHSAYEKSKDCPERTFANPYYVIQHLSGEHELPIRITNITASDFLLELGFLYIPPSILNLAENKTIAIRPIMQDTSLIYHFDRLEADCITYLSLGNIPAKSYTINVDPTLQSYWPSKIHGIDPEGSLFDGKTGRKLPADADVTVGKKYYLLRQQKIFRSYTGITYQLLSTKSVSWSTWYVYEIQATDYAEDAAKFFLDMHCRLTDTPISIQPIWPPHIQAPFMVRHDQNELYILISGQSGLRTDLFPSSRMRTIQRRDENALFEISCTQHQHLVSAGRAHTLQYIYLWQEPLKQTISPPSIKVTNSKGEQLQPGVSSVVPPGKMLTVCAPFDGKVTCSCCGNISWRHAIKANEPLYVDNLQIGTEVAVFQGLDCVWSVSFRKQQTREPSEKIDNDTLLALKSFRGPKVQINHRIGAIAESISSYPKVSLWLRQQILRGEINQDALIYLKHLVETSKR